MITANDTNPELKELAGTVYRKGLPGPIYLLINFVWFACHIWAMYNDLYFLFF